MAITHPPPTISTGATGCPARGFAKRRRAAACERRRALSFFRSTSPRRDASETEAASVLMLRVVSRCARSRPFMARSGSFRDAAGGRTGGSRCRRGANATGRGRVGLASTAQPRSVANARQSARHIGHVTDLQKAASRHVSQNSWPHGVLVVSPRNNSRHIAHSASLLRRRGRTRDNATRLMPFRIQRLMGGAVLCPRMASTSSRRMRFRLRTCLRSTPCASLSMRSVMPSLVPSAARHRSLASSNVRIRMMFDGLSLICWRMRRSYSSSWYLRYAAAAASAMVAATIG